MKLLRNGLIAGLIVSALLSAPVAGPATPAAANAALDVEVLTPRAYLPGIFKPQGCPATSSNSYSVGPVYQWDDDNPVRPAWNHADKNISLRGYVEHVGTSLGWKHAPADDPVGPPQPATLFGPARVPTFTKGYQIRTWNWQASPDPGTPGGIYDDDNKEITVIGMQTTLGEQLHVPNSGYDIGAGMEVVIMYADADTVALHYTREDSGAKGYTIHVDNICTDPNLLALYNSLEATRNQWYGGHNSGGLDYNLVTLSSGQVFGTARGSEIRVGIVDSGNWMNPMYCEDWWSGYC